MFGLAELKGLKRLESLWVDRTEPAEKGSVEITDAGLQHLIELKSLKELAIQQSRTTADGVARLKRAIPALRVVGGGQYFAAGRSPVAKSTQSKP